MSNWYYKNKIVKEIPEGMIGFVYLITNITNNKGQKKQTPYTSRK